MWVGGIGGRRIGIVGIRAGGVSVRSLNGLWGAGVGFWVGISVGTGRSLCG